MFVIKKTITFIKTFVIFFENKRIRLKKYLDLYLIVYSLQSIGIVLI